MRQSSAVKAKAEKMASKLLYVHTFGCQMNEYDSLRVQRLLGLEGYAVTENPKEADIIFVNTCSVRAKAEQKAYSLLGRLKGIKVRNPNALLVVGGCVAEQQREKIIERFPHVDLVIGTRAISRLPDMIKEVRRTRTQKWLFPESEESCGMEWLDSSSPMWKTGIVASVTIMQGCDNFCTYCIVPYVRGRERSRAPQEIIAEIRSLIAKGAKEVLLLGQNVNSYGKNLDPPISFSELIKMIASETDVLRIRFTTSHPKDLTEDLMKCFAEVPELCPQLHLPFQAGSDRILKKMNRKYTQTEYLRKIERLRDIRPDISLSADVMVGFPGEREEDFLETLKVVESVQFDNLFSFKYSDRPFTVASRMEPKVDEKTKSRWLSTLQALQAEITLKKNLAEVGSLREVLVEGKSKTGRGQLTGRTPQGRIVNFVGPSSLVGKIVAVRIVEGYAHSLKGKLIEE